MLANGMNNEEILLDYPELELDDILACLAYAADREHKASGVRVAWNSFSIKIYRVA